MNLLEDLWYGNIHPNEDGAFWTPECEKLLELYKRNSEKLEVTLNEQEKVLLERMQECWMELQENTERGAFLVGFRLAVQLMTAAM